jgi:hypothetical protein
MLGVVFFPSNMTNGMLYPGAPHQPTTLRELLAQAPQQLAICDIAVMNLLCAGGLSGSEDLNIQSCLAQLDTWAKRVDKETKRGKWGQPLTIDNLLVCLTQEMGPRLHFSH